MMHRLAAIALLAVALTAGLASPAKANSRAHVYLFRGLADIFSTGMDVLTEELTRRGVYATSHSHTEWKALADRAAADYKAGKEGPIILIGHSLGADAVMEMADYLGDKGVPVALVMPFDGTQSFSATANVARVINFTQRDYAYMRKGPGFRGTLFNVDLSSDRDIGHLNIDKSPRLHARAISEVLAVAVGHMGLPTAAEKAAAPPLPSAAGATAPRHETMGRGDEQIPRGVPVGAPSGAPGGTVIGAPTGTEAARSVSPALPPNAPATRPATGAPANPGYADPGAGIPGHATSGFAGPAFPPQPPPVRPLPARPLDIPD